MNRLHIGFILMLAACCVPLLEGEAKAQAEPPFNYARLSLTFYSESRQGYKTLPVRVVGASAGRLNASQPFKVFAAALQNDTAKSVSKVKLSYFVFRAGDLGEVLEKGETPLIKIDLHAHQTRNVKIHVFDFEDCWLFKDTSEDHYRIELAVTEVHYADGSIWRGTDLPRKLDPSQHP
jgi:hypothetical protein